MLLKADHGSHGSAGTDARIAEALERGRATVERVRRRCVHGGLLDALVRRPQPERPEKRNRDGEREARVVTVACSQMEHGQARWTMRLLAEKLVQWGSVDQISHHMVWVTFKKRNARRVVKDVFLSSTGGERGMRVPEGRCAGGVSPSVRSARADELSG